MTIRNRTWTNAKGRKKTAWIADIVDANGNRHRKNFKTRSDAMTYAVELRKEIERGRPADQSERVTLEQAIVNFLEYVRLRRDRDEITSKTARTIEQCLSRHVLNPKLGLADLYIDELRPRHIEEFRDQLLASGLKHTSVKKIMGCLKRCLDRAVSREWVVANSAKGVRVTSPRGASAPIDIPTEAEVSAIISAAPASLKLPIAVAATTGVRASELWGLRWGDLDLDARKISIQRRVLDNGDVGPPKSKAGRRSIPISQAIADALHLWRSKSEHPENADYVFSNRKGGSTNHLNTTRRHWKPLLKRLSLTCRWHDLRHFAISTWLEEGIPPRAVMSYAGHSTIAVTFDVYGHLLRSADHSAAFDAVSDKLDLDDTHGPDDSHDPDDT